MLSFLLFLLIVCLIAAVLIWCVDQFPFGPPAAKQIAKIIVVIIALIYALQRLPGL